MDKTDPNRPILDHPTKETDARKGLSDAVAFFPNGSDATFDDWLEDDLDGFEGDDTFAIDDTGDGFDDDETDPDDQEGAYEPLQAPIFDLTALGTGEGAIVDPRRSLPVLRPVTRSDCADVPRPCPFVSCRHHLYLDVRNDGVLRVNFPDREPHEMVASCALDLAEDGPRTLDSIAGFMGMSKERARQLERSGLLHVRLKFSLEDVDQD